MTTVESTNPNFVRFVWAGVGLALFAALTYLLIGLRYLGVGGLQVADDGGNIIYVAAASYLIGGLLILLRNRWLWIAGAAINALVILFYLNLYLNRPEVLMSPGGMVSKLAQILLEIVLIYLIAADWRQSHHRNR